MPTLSLIKILSLTPVPVQSASVGKVIDCPGHTLVGILDKSGATGASTIIRILPVVLHKSFVL